MLARKIQAKLDAMDIIYHDSKECINNIIAFQCSFLKKFHHLHGGEND